MSGKKTKDTKDTVFVYTMRKCPSVNKDVNWKFPISIRKTIYLGVSHSATESRLKSWSFSQTHGYSQGRIGYGSRYGFLLATFHEALPRRIAKPRITIILGVLVFHHLHFRAHEVAVSQALQPIFTANRFQNLASELARSRFLPDPSVALPARAAGCCDPKLWANARGVEGGWTPKIGEKLVKKCWCRITPHPRINGVKCGRRMESGNWWKFLDWIPTTYTPWEGIVMFPFPES